MIFSGMYMLNKACSTALCRPLTRTCRPVQPISQSDTLVRALLNAHGELIGGVELARCLGFKTTRAFQKAAAAGRLPVETFFLEGRRGRFARTRDIAFWLASLSEQPDKT